MTGPLEDAAKDAASQHESSALASAPESTFGCLVALVTSWRLPSARLLGFREAVCRCISPFGDDIDYRL
jgi:hypothetical protein